jgi:hypothetical protein
MKLAGHERCNESHFIRMAPRLVSLIFYVEYMCRSERCESTWTSFIRPRLDDSGIHALGRAADMSIRDLPLDLVEKIIQGVKARYPYGKAPFSSALLHRGNGYGGNDAGAHIHFQVAESSPGL